MLGLQCVGVSTAMPGRSCSRQGTAVGAILAGEKVLTVTSRRWKFRKEHVNFFTTLSTAGEKEMESLLKPEFEYYLEVLSNVVDR